jgi:hypothetical protein
MTDTRIKQLLPVIRRVLPTLIAQDIVGVQPMDMDISSLYPHQMRMKRINTTYKGIKNLAKYLNKNYWPYQYTINNQTTNIEVERWCYDNFKCRYWRSLYGVYAFKREADYSMFLLRWS